MKKQLTAALILLGILLALASGAPAEEAGDRVLVPKGGHVKLTAEWDRDTLGANPRLIWESSNPAVATVNGGHVRGIKPGTALITCTAVRPDGRREATSCPVEVYQTVSGLVWQQKNLTLITGQTSDPVSVTVNPADAAFPKLTWSSADPRIATVDDRGRITGVQAGRVSIYGTLHEPGVANQRKMWVTVKVNQAVTDIGLSSPAITLARGGRETLSALVFPENAASTWIAWSSSDENVATVVKGRVTGVGVGHCTITAAATDGSGVTAACEVQVIQPMTSLELGPDPLVVMAGSSGQITAKIGPPDTTQPKLYWYCDEGDIARVDADGLVTGRSPGKCRVTADAADMSALTKSVWVYVEPASPLGPGKDAAAQPWLTLSLTNRCTALTVMGFEYEAVLRTTEGEILATETGAAEEDVVLWPGAEKCVYCPVPGGEKAARAEITVTAVTCSDGRRWEIPEDLRETWAFSAENTNNNH